MKLFSRTAKVTTTTTTTTDRYLAAAARTVAAYSAATHTVNGTTYTLKTI